jgi:hypothetical protein
MVVQKSSEVLHVIMPRVAVVIAITNVHIAIAHVRIAVVGIFLVHEGARILPYLIANARVVPEIILQGRMVAHKFRIV